MSFLSDMFDPAGVFSGDKGDVVNNLLDPIGGMMDNFGVDPWGANEFHQDVGDWMDDLGDTTEELARSRTKNIYNEAKSGNLLKRDASTGFSGFGGSPIGTRFTNKVNGENDRPLWDMYGGSTPDDYKYAEDRGNDTSAQRGLTSVGNTVGKGILNAYTFGLGSTALDSLNAYGYGDDASAEDILKRGAKNYALNYAMNTGLDAAGAAIPETGGYAEQGGGYVGNNEYGGTGGFNLGQTLGAGEYSPQVNSTAKAGIAGGLGASANGGNSDDIRRGIAQGAGMSGGKNLIGMGMDYLGSMFKDDENAPQYYGSSPSLNPSNPIADSLNESTMENAPAQRPYGSNPTGNSLMAQAGMERPATYQNIDQPAAANGPSEYFTNFMSAFNGGGNGSGGGGNYGDMAASLFGLYNANKQRKRLKEQSDSLSSLFSPNSPYAAQMRQRLERKDAAAGRRSQYGPREAQLAAMLADRQAQTMPQQERYAAGMGGYENQMVNAGLRGLGQMFQRQQPYQGAFGMSGIPFRPEEY